jgi:hypothetical protein
MGKVTCSMSVSLDDRVGLRLLGTRTFGSGVVPLRSETAGTAA